MAKAKRGWGVLLWVVVGIGAYFVLYVPIKPEPVNTTPMRMVVKTVQPGGSRTHDATILITEPGLDDIAFYAEILHDMGKTVEVVELPTGEWDEAQKLLDPGTTEKDQVDFHTKWGYIGKAHPRPNKYQSYGLGKRGFPIPPFIEDFPEHDPPYGEAMWSGH